MEPILNSLERYSQAKPMFKEFLLDKIQAVRIFWSSIFGRSKSMTSKRNEVQHVRRWMVRLRCVSCPVVLEPYVSLYAAITNLCALIIQFNRVSCRFLSEVHFETQWRITEDTGATRSIRRLTYLSCLHQPQTHMQKHMHTSSLICLAQILDQGACLQNQRSNHKAITLVTHQQRADSNSITFRLQRPAADKRAERGGCSVFSSGSNSAGCIIAPCRVHFKTCV